MLLHTDGLPWTILCPGPSLWELDAIDAPGPVVSVNAAIKHPTEASYWCMNDGPEFYEEVWQGLTWEQRNAGPVVWALRKPGDYAELGYRVHPTGGGQWFHRNMPFA